MATVRAKKKDADRTRYADIETEQARRTEVTPAAALMLIVNAVVCVIAVLLPFIPIGIDEKLMDRTTVSNMIGVINRGLEQDVFRMDSAKLILVYVVAVVFIAVGITGSYYRDKVSPFFTLGGAVSLIFIASSWLHIASPTALQKTFTDSGIPVIVLLFSALAAITSVLSFCLYKEKRNSA